MYWIPKSSIEALVVFSELVSEVSTPREVLPLLADSAVDALNADGAAIFEVSKETAELHLIAHSGVPASVAAIKAEPGLIGADLTRELLLLCKGQFAHAHPFPLISNKDLFGALVLFFKEASVLSEGQLALVRVLVHLSAIALGKTDQYTKLRKSYDDLQASQEILARTEKLRALGQMSASISHDLKNLLAPLSLNVQLLKRVAHDPARVLMLADKLEQSFKRGIETVERIRDFSRQSPVQENGEDVDLDALVREAIEIARPRLVEIALKLELSGNLPSVHLRSSDFLSAIVNLVFNAIDALGGHGEITVRSGTSNAGAWVKVSDNGPGMPDSVRSKIFEPFFTTKGKEGTGLGLSMTYAFVERHQGRIHLETAVGKGTTFTLWFPAIQAVAHAAEKKDAG